MLRISVRGRSRVAFPALAAIAVLWMSGAANGQITNIVNGVQEHAEPSTGALIVGDPDSGQVTCTVSLIGCDAAITTAHCFNASPETKTWLYFQHAGFVEIESATRHPAYAEALATFPPWSERRNRCSSASPEFEPASIGSGAVSKTQRENPGEGDETARQ